jgi:hypothetical protein
MGSEKGLGIWKLSTGDAASVASFVDTSWQEFSPVLHPSGKWLAYQAGDFNTVDSSVRPFPEGEGQWKAAEGLKAMARHAIWSPAGDRLYYVQDRPDGKFLMAVSFDASGGKPVLGPPVQLFKAPSDLMTVMSDDRFGFVVDEEPEAGTQAPATKGIVLVENWLGRLKP